VALLNLGSVLRQFGLEASPCVLMVVGVLLLEQPEGFLGAELGNAGKILDAESVENLSPFQPAFAQTQRALDGFVWQGQFSHLSLAVLL
jgi:hypothetical protein